MNSKDFMFDILKDIKTDLADEFDRNFERQAFFDTPWVNRQLRPSDNVLNVHGGAGLRGSIMASIGNGKILFTSSLPYASIHNNGGTIVITAKMKKYFWYMHLKATNATKIFNIKSRKQVNNKRTQALSIEATYWKALALKKVGDTLKIPKRQYIGNHPRVKQIIQENVEKGIQRLGEHFKLEFKKQ
jgi:phage gpG-like protein